MSRPTVTIGLPVYNGENYLAEAIESVIAQSFTDFELIISDNGSTDETTSICRRYAEKDDRIRVHRVSTNQGATWNFNRVEELARGQYFRWLAHDDRIAPDCIRQCVRALESHPDAVLAHTAVEVLDAQGESAGEFHDDDDLRLDAPMPHIRFTDALREHRCFEVFGLIRLDLLRQVPSMGAHGHADGILISRLALLGPFAKVDAVLFAERKHAEQSMSRYNAYGSGDGGEDGPPDYYAYAEWYDPAAGRKRTYPYWRLLAEHLKSVAATPSVRFVDRVRCIRPVLGWLRHNRYWLRKDLNRPSMEPR